jgi:hypothetical protein
LTIPGSSGKDAASDEEIAVVLYEKAQALGRVGAAVALSQELAESADALLALLAMVPPTPEAGRPARLRAVATGISELLKRQLASVGVLVGAAESARGRRALAMLGEGGERLAAAVLAQSRQSQRAAAL